MVAYSDNNFKQEAVIEFLLKEGMAAREISDGLRNVYGEWALSYPTVRRWVAEFKGGISDIIDKPRSGRPSSAVTEANKQRVDELIRSDRRVTTKDIIDVIGISHGSVHNIIIHQRSWILNGVRPTAHCKRHHSCDCCKGVDCTAPSIVQPRSGPIRFSPVWASERLSERPEV